MARARTTDFRPDWLTKTLAGVILGLSLSLALTGLYSLAAAGVHLSQRAQLAMWSTWPMWVAALAGSYAFRSGARAWAWLGAANLLAWGAFLLLRHS